MWVRLTHHSVVVCLLRRCRCKHRKQCLLGCEHTLRTPKIIYHMKGPNVCFLSSLYRYYDTLQGTNISPTKGVLKTIFLFLLGGISMDILGVFLHPIKVPKVTFPSLAPHHLHTPWKINGWNLKITHVNRKFIWTKPSFMGSMLIFRGVSQTFPHFPPFNVSFRYAGAPDMQSPVELED